MNQRPSRSTFEVTLTVGKETQCIKGRAAELLAALALHHAAINATPVGKAVIHFAEGQVRVELRAASRRCGSTSSPGHREPPPSSMAYQLERNPGGLLSPADPEVSMRIALVLFGLLLVSCSAPGPSQPTEPPSAPVRADVPVEAVQPTNEPAPVQIGPRESDFEVVFYRVVDEPPGTRIIGEIRNKGSVPAGVELQAVARDVYGTVIDDVRFWPAGTRNIPPGATQSFVVSGTRAGTRGVVIQPITARTWLEPGGMRQAVVATGAT